jgi:CheY-like chemotaxis protein
VQVVANLLNNANKYTPEGGRIELRLDEDGERLRAGGARRRHRHGAATGGRVFDLFTQAERTPDRSQGGLGLGLALVKSLVELHGGTVQAASAGLGKGSTFTVRLPRHTRKWCCRWPRAQRPRAGGQAPLRMLLVDDNLDAAHTLQLFLAAGGHRSKSPTARPTRSTWPRVFVPDVCLLDIGLPDFDGNELARRLRRLPQATGATLVAMTGYGRQQDRDAAMAAGFDHYMVKPVNTVELSDLLADGGGGGEEAKVSAELGNAARPGLFQFPYHAIRHEGAGMESVGVVLAMLLAVIGSGYLVRMLPFGVPLPLVQIALGAVIAGVFGHGVALDPEIFFLLFLPPLLFLDGWRIPKVGLFRDKGTILELALGLVRVHGARRRLPDPLAGARDAAAGRLCAGRHRRAHRSGGRVLDRRADAGPAAPDAHPRGRIAAQRRHGLVCFRFAVAAAMTGAFRWPGPA